MYDQAFEEIISFKGNNIIKEIIPKTTVSLQTFTTNIL